MHTMKTEVSPDVPIRYYNGSKKPAMPEIEGRRQVLPLRILANQRVLLIPPFLSFFPKEITHSFRWSYYSRIYSPKQ